MSLVTKSKDTQNTKITKKAQKRAIPNKTNEVLKVPKECKNA